MKRPRRMNSKARRSEDQDIANLIVADRDEGWNRFLSKNGGALKNMARKWGRRFFRMTFEDVWQEIVIKCWQSAHAYDASRGSLLNWCWRNVENRLMTLWKKERRKRRDYNRERGGENGEKVMQTLGIRDRRAQVGEFLEWLENAEKRMPRPWRRPWKLYKKLGKAALVAKRLHCTRQAVSNNVWSARKWLRERWEGDE